MLSIRRNIGRIRVLYRSLEIVIRSEIGVIYFIKSVYVAIRQEGIHGLKKSIIALNENAPHLLWNTRRDYKSWINSYDTLTKKQREKIKEKLNGPVDSPLISVVMPVYNSRIEWLVEAVESVRSQLYPNWELCIADDLSTDPQIQSLLIELCDSDPRIKVIFRNENGHISAASNSALSLATGQWVVLLDHDDLLSEQALYWVANAITQDSNIRMIYSDEDKVNEKNIRYDPYFKCDWNPDLFLSHNMFCHLGVYYRQLVEDVGGFRLGYEGAQDYDLALRCMNLVSNDQIYHIPRVLYHWRSHEQSTAQSIDSKPYAMLAAEKSIQDHIARTGVKASVTSNQYGHRIQYMLPEKTPLVSLIIPTRNGLNLIRTCLESILLKTDYDNYEILVVDNGSDVPEVLEYLDSVAVDPRIEVLRDNRPFNYSQLNNMAIRKARGKIIGLINNDIEVISPGWLSEMVSHALRPEIGVVGARLLYPDDTIQHAGVVLGIGGVAGHSHKHFPAESGGYFSRLKIISNYSVVTGACMVFEKELFEVVGELNELDLAVAFNDVDFCLRVREAGYRNIWTPYAELYHHESISRGSEDTEEKQARFKGEVEYMIDKWGDKLNLDPAYNPNLSLKKQDFSYASPRYETQ